MVTVLRRMYRKTRGLRALTAVLVLAFLLAMTVPTYATDSSASSDSVTASGQGDTATTESPAADEVAAPAEEPASEPVAEPADPQPADEPAAEAPDDSSGSGGGESAAPADDGDKAAPDDDPVEDAAPAAAPVVKATVEEASDDPEPEESSAQETTDTVTKTFSLKLGAPSPDGHFWVAYKLDGTSKTLDLSGSNPFTADVSVPKGSVISDVAWYGGWDGMEFLLGTTDGETALTDVTNSFAYSTSISGHVFDDVNGNGVQDSGEEALAGRSVSLVVHTGGTATTFATVVTDSNGYYHFNSLPPASYTLEVSTPSGWTQTTASSSVAIKNCVQATYDVGQRATGTNTSGCIAVDVSADSTCVLSGESVTLTYRITNTGNVTLNNVQLVDDHLGPIGDTISSLAPGETIVRTATEVVTADITHVATVTGYFQNGNECVKVTACDSVSIDVVSPAISLTKTASPDSLDDTGTVTYTYVVTNVGDVTLHGFTLVDSELGDIEITTESLAPGESFTVTRDAVIGSTTTNEATVTGIDTCGHEVTDTATATVTVTRIPTGGEGGEAGTPSLPFTESVVSTTGQESLPFTGGDFLALLGMAGASGVTGITFRRRARKAA